jgi:transaldolase
MTIKQIKEILKALHPDTPTILSVFAGRIADTGRDPIPLIKNCVAQIKNFKNVELLWASPRELLNIFQAQTAGCDIITIGEDLLSKMDLIGKDLNEFSRETVEMFYKDAIFSKFKI